MIYEILYLMENQANYHKKVRNFDLIRVFSRIELTYFHNFFSVANLDNDTFDDFTQEIFLDFDAMIRITKLLAAGHCPDLQ